VPKLLLRNTSTLTTMLHPLPVVTEPIDRKCICQQNKVQCFELRICEINFMNWIPIFTSIANRFIYEQWNEDLCSQNRKFLCSYPSTRAKGSFRASTYMNTVHQTMMHEKLSFFICSQWNLVENWRTRHPKNLKPQAKAVDWQVPWVLHD